MNNKDKSATVAVNLRSIFAKNCYSSCQYYRNQSGDGWCYMFRDKPYACTCAQFKKIKK
jgi:hypothetical protein